MARDRDVLLHQPTRPYFCEEWIEIPADPWASTYCKLPAGHAGAHSAHYPAEKAEAST